jgi:hypothetical protein
LEESRDGDALDTLPGCPMYDGTDTVA